MNFGQIFAMFLPLLAVEGIADVVALPLDEILVPGEIGLNLILVILLVLAQSLTSPKGKRIK